MVTRSTLMSLLLACVAGAALLGGAPTAHADTVSECTLPYELISSGCPETPGCPVTGLIALVGTIQTTVRQNVKPDGTIQLSFTSKMEGTGSDEAGNHYTFKAHDHMASYSVEDLNGNGLPDDGGPIWNTVNFQLVAITHGKCSNLIVHQTIHQVVSASGEVGAPQLGNFFEECRG